MRITNNFNLPQEYIDALVWHETNHRYTGRDKGYSVSTLIGPARQAMLQKLHPDIVLDAMDYVNRAMGTSWHDYMHAPAIGNETEGTITEKRFETRINLSDSSELVTGQMDSVKLEAGGTVKDWKFIRTVAISLGALKDWTKQLNFYAYILSCNGVTIKKLQVMAAFKDWTKWEMMSKGGDYPRSPIVLYDLELWSPEKTESYIKDRLLLLLEAEKEIPFCSPDDTWERPASYKVMKNSNKRATRVFDSAMKAQDYINNLSNKALKDGKYRIDFHEGLIVRCPDWCDVRSVCSQWHETNQYKKEQQDNE